MYDIRSSMGSEYTYFSLKRLGELLDLDLSRLPFSLKILLEATARQLDGLAVTKSHLKQLCSWGKHNTDGEVAFKPSRIVLQDFTGVPAVVDLAALRSAVARSGGDPSVINPLVPVDLVVDHSVMLDRVSTDDALEYNMQREFERNGERYRLLRWAAESLDNFRAVPPATGIVHQVNLEYLATLVTVRQVGDELQIFPDSLVGTDSHTTMINGLGILGWGVGGIEAEACMLGQPLYFSMPEVVGFRLTGCLAEGSTATDLALTVTEMLRKHGVVSKFVEFCGDGLDSLSLADRATVANMSPEYGATVGFFPVDDETFNYMLATGRDPRLVDLAREYYMLQGMYREPSTPEPIFNDLLELDLADVVPSLAGPKRPQDRVELKNMKEEWHSAMRKPINDRGFALSQAEIEKSIRVSDSLGREYELRTGDVVIAAITSCTNTSNPSVMVAAGMMAQRAVALGLSVPPYVKCSLTPGSRVVTEYLERGSMLEPLARLGFSVAGYGCATCIGNSGPLEESLSQVISEHDMTVASVLSGNRNFEGRIHPQVKANYLASPPLVVAYALAGTVNIDLYSEPLGTDKDGNEVYLRDLWPSSQEVDAVINSVVSSEQFTEQYSKVFSGNKEWNSLSVPAGLLYEWDPGSTYIQEPPFFIEGAELNDGDIHPIRNAHVLALFGDSVTTDHISPAGSIPSHTPAGGYLQELGVNVLDFNSYGSRRGNDRVMTRGTFANIRIRNQMVPGSEGGVTLHIPSGKVLPIYEAAMLYKENNTPLVIFAGKEYGTGSSRDWAAKGTNLLGVKAVIAESFERIHRSNLVGMGVLPLEFEEGQSWRTLDLDGSEVVTVPDLSNDIEPGGTLAVNVTRANNESITFYVKLRLDSVVDIEYYRNGGILPTVLQQMQLAKSV